MEIDFETKLAAAGEVLEKLAAERGLDLNDFTEQETVDLLSTIMGEGEGGGDGGGEPEPTVAPKVASAPSTPAAPATTKVAYEVALGEVMKVAAANGYDLNQATPAELHSAVEAMQERLADPTFVEKQAALQEKIAEADALGRVMAHAYVDELGKIAGQAAPTSATEKKAAFVRELRAKFASDDKDADDKKGMPFEKKEKGEKEKGEKEDEGKEKEAFAKAASFRAAELLIENGVNPRTGEKFASEQERVDAGAFLLLQQKGYVEG